MGDLQEIRRYWPSATGKYGYYSARVRGVSMSVWATDDYGSPHPEVCVIDGRTDVARVRTNRWHRIHRDNNPIGPTIAAAMAADVQAALTLAEELDLPAQTAFATAERKPLTIGVAAPLQLTSEPDEVANDDQ